MFFLTAFNHSALKPFNPVLLHLGGQLEVRWYAVLILSGAMLALFLAIIEGKKIGVSSGFLEDLVLYGIPIAVVGARIYYVAFQWNGTDGTGVDGFSQNPISALYIWQGGLAIHGALIAAVLWGLYFCNKRGVNFLKAVDLAAPGFLIAQAMGRWGNFMNQEAHGPVVGGTHTAIINGISTTVANLSVDAQRMWLEHLHIPAFIINQMYIIPSIQGINGAYTTTDVSFPGYYQPTFLYESLWNLLGVLIILILRRTKKFYLGDLGLFYLIWYSFIRFFVEGMRTDSLYIGHSGIRIAQVMSAILFFGGLIMIVLRHIFKWYPKYYYQVLEETQQAADKPAAPQTLGQKENIEKTPMQE